MSFCIPLSSFVNPIKTNPHSWSEGWWTKHIKEQKNQVLEMTIPTLSCLAISNNTSLFIFLVEWLTKRYNPKYMVLIRTWFKFYLFQQFLSFVNCVCPIFCTIKFIIVRPCTISFSSIGWNITGNLDTLREIFMILDKTSYLRVNKILSNT